MTSECKKRKRTSQYRYLAEKVDNFNREKWYLRMFATCGRTYQSGRTKGSLGKYCEKTTKEKMYHFCDKIHKGKFDLRTWKLIFKRDLKLKDRKFSVPLNRQLLNVKTSIYCIQTNYFKSLQQGTPLNQNLLNLISGKGFNLSRNSSISKTVKSFFGRTQDKEKLKNFIFFGVLFSAVVGVELINLKLERHQDNIYIEIEEPRKN